MPDELKITNLLGAGVLGNSLCSLRHCVLGEFSGKEKSDGGLHLPRGDGGALVVMSKARGFGGDSLEDVVDEAVHDAHGLAGDTSVGMDLLQHLVDVDCVGFLPPALLLLISLGDVLLGLTGLLGGFSTSFGWHDAAESRDDISMSKFPPMRPLYMRGKEYPSAALADRRTNGKRSRLARRRASNTYI